MRNTFIISPQIANLWSAPARRRLFEDRLVEALKAVREACSISAAMCTTSGAFFETTLGEQPGRQEGRESFPSVACLQDVCICF